MASKKNQPAIDPNAEIDADNQPAAESTPAESAESRKRADPVADLDMSEFERRDDRGDWLTFREAAEMLAANGVAGFDADDLDKGAQKIRNAAKTRGELSHDGGNLIYVGVRGYQIPPLGYLRRSAVTAYGATVASGPINNGRAGRNGAKRWIIRVKPEHEADVRALLADRYGIALEIASTPKTKSTPAADAGQPTPIEAAIAAESDQPAEIAAD